MFKKIISLSFLGLFLILTLGACSFTFPWEKERAPLTMETSQEGEDVDLKTKPSSGDLKKFGSEESLKTFLAGAPSGGGLSSSWLLAESSYGLVDEANLVSFINNENPIFSSADIIKYDSGYIYALVKNEVIIISVQPAGEAKIISKLSFPSRPLEIVASAGRLAILGTENQLKNTDLYKSFGRKNDYTFLKIYDVFNPADPKEIRSFYFEGNYSGLRLSGNYLYLLTASPAYYLDNEPLTPRIIESNKIVSGDCRLSKGCVNPPVFYFDHPYINYNFLSLSAISLADKEEPINNQLFLIDSNYNLSISANGNFYLSHYSSLSTYDLELEIKRDKILPKLNSSDQRMLQEIEESPNYVLNINEKRIKIAALISRYLTTLTEEERNNFQAEVDSDLVNKIKQRISDLEKTDIYKFALKSGKIEYQARGQVSGKFLNGSGFDEQDGKLRVVTVRNKLWSLLFEEDDKYYSSIYVLDSSLRSLNALENIATDHKLYRAYFLGDRIYLSTTDSNAPVYVVKLDDEDKPNILGAIKIPNLNNLYSFDKSGDLVLSFGRDIQSDSTSEGLKLSLFDFSDLKKPKELSGYLIGDSTSDSMALKDYRSLVYFSSQKTLILPTVLSENDLLNFAGVLVYDTEDNTFNLKGRVDHLFSSNFSPVDYWRGLNYFDNEVRRSLIVGDYLFTFSNKYLRISSLRDLSEIKTVSLAPEAERIFIPSANPSISEPTNPEPTPAPEIPVGNEELPQEILPSDNANSENSNTIEEEQPVVSDPLTPPADEPVTPPEVILPEELPETPPAE